jgi:hypothetical protein
MTAVLRLICFKHRAKSVSPKPNRLMADVDAAFVQKILHIPQRERKPHIHHNGQADDLGASLKVTKGGTFCHPATLGGRPARLKKVSSDSAALQVRPQPLAQSDAARQTVGCPSADQVKIPVDREAG